MSEQNSKKRKAVIGKVTSNKMDKTIVVVIDRYITDSLYKKIVKRRTKLHAHDPENTCKIGDVVKIAETKPRSKTKAWELVEIVKKADLIEV